MGVPDLKQHEGGWAGEDYDNTKYKIRKLGCSLTAISDALRFYGVDTDPLKLNTWLKANKGFDGARVKFEQIPEYVKTFSKAITYVKIDSPSNETILQELNSSRAAIVKVVSLRVRHSLIFLLLRKLLEHLS